MLCETVCPLVKTLSRDARAKESQPRSGVRMQPTPKGVGDPLKTGQPPKGAKDSLHDCHANLFGFSIAKAEVSLPAVPTTLKY
jgi:hypothetical protein